MPQDAFTLRRVTKELKEKFVGGKISKINMPERDELSLIIYTLKGTVKLEISANPKNNRISVSSDEKPNPQVAPNFCMLLRKHLQNAEITDVGQVGFERIIHFDFLCFSEFSVSQMTLYCEIMGKYSNVILVEKGVILGAMKQTSLEENAKRVLFSGAKYALPLPQDKADPTDLQAVKSAFLHKCGDAAKFISTALEGIAYSTALEIVQTYGEDVSAEQAYDYINGEHTSPCVTFNEYGQPNDFKVRSAQKEVKYFDSLLEAQSAYYSYVYVKKTFEDKKRQLSGALSSSVKKLEKRLAQIEEKLSECEQAEAIKLKGELITANIYLIERGMTSFEATNYYDESCPKIRIELDRQLTPAQNAQKYYKKYAKLKRTVTALSGQKSEAQEKLSYLKSIESNICAAECLFDLRETEEELIELGLIKSVEKKRKKDEPLPFRQFNVDGFKVLAGRNNVQNDRLFKSLSPDDMWLHVQKYHSCHTAIISDGREIPDKVLLYAAQICSYYSESRERDKAAVDYTLKKFVKKPPKANLGFVTYTQYKTIIVAPNAHQELKDE